MKTKMPTWLTDAIIYEIYPQSFFDSNKDGIGDLPGIIYKLDYLHDLGINTIWLNPCFTSPFQDAGYDVEDYYTVAPRYGTNDDLTRLFEEAKKRDIRVLLDLVPGHTSIRHPWFAQSQLSQKNQYSDWFIWNDSVWHGSDPGLPVVRGFSERNASYVTNFFYFQPALNYGFAHPDPNKPWQQSVNSIGPQMVRKEMKNIMKFWLNKGASGFRVDMAASLVKHDPGHLETSRYWKEVREWFDSEYPDAVLISEWGVPAEAIPAGFHVDMLLGFANPGIISLFRKRGVGNFRDPYGWSFFDQLGHGDITQFLDEYMENYKRTVDLGYMAFITGNHDDHPRIADGRSVDMLKLVYLFILTMPGTPIIYNGDEIGMHYVEGLPSKEGGYERTGVRTPMQWNSKINAGFSEAPKELLYLPVSDEFSEINVEHQENFSESLLNVIKRLITTKKEHSALKADAKFEPLFAQSGKLPFVYARKSENEYLVISLNPSDKPVSCTINLPNDKNHFELIFGHAELLRDYQDQWKILMPPVSGVIITMS